MFLKEVSYTHEDWTYLIKNTVKNSSVVKYYVTSSDVHSWLICAGTDILMILISVTDNLWGKEEEMIKDMIMNFIKFENWDINLIAIHWIEGVLQLMFH